MQGFTICLLFQACYPSTDFGVLKIKKLIDAAIAISVVLKCVNNNNKDNLQFKLGIAIDTWRSLPQMPFIGLCILN